MNDLAIEIIVQAPGWEAGRMGTEEKIDNGSDMRRKLSATQHERKGLAL